MGKAEVIVLTLDEQASLPESPERGVCRCSQLELPMGISVWADVNMRLHRRDVCHDAEG